jgi:serine/threonine protein kinase
MALGNGPDRISRYEIQGLIARGGMARVYLARDPNTTRMVVVKLLDATFDSSDVRDRFDREARSLASLSHPNIVPIYDYGNFQDSPFIVMEYVRGETIEEKIKRRAALSVADKLRLMSDVCAGLTHAHAAGIIHRDIKPGNLMVGEDNRLKIIDFGIARVSDSNLTRLQTMASFGQVQIGTVGYMSPEQMQGEEIDQRTDIFSVGAVCYELLAYREAFPGSTTKDIEAAVMRTPPSPLARLIPDLDAEIDQILARAMARNPADRYQTSLALAEAFERCRGRLDPRAATIRRPEPTRPVPPVRAPRPATAPRPTTGDLTPLPPPRAGGPQTISVDPTVLIDRASNTPRVHETIEPTVVIDRHDLMRHLSRNDPTPAAPLPPPRVQSSPPRTVPPVAPGKPRPVDDPTIMVTRPQQQRASSTSTRSAAAGFSLGSWFKSLFPGGGSKPRPSASARQPAKTSAHGRSNGEWTRGVLIAAGMLAIAALLVFAIIQVVRWSSTPGQALTVTRPVGGTVTGAGILCGSKGSDCTTTRPTGDNVQLQGEADTGFIFSGFTGDCPVTGRLAMTQARTCGATFTPVTAPPSALLTLSVDLPTGGTVYGSGEIECGTRGTKCSANIPSGQEAKLSFAADDGFQFLGFGGDCSSEGAVVMTAARTCFAKSVKSNLASNTDPRQFGGGRQPKPAVVPPPPAVAGQGGGQGTGQGTVNPQPVQPPVAVAAPGTNSNPGATGPTTPPTPSTAAQTTTTVPVEGPAPTNQPKDVKGPVTAEEHAKVEIKSLVTKYCAAYETLKAENLEALFPQIRQTTLKEQFRQYKALQCTITAPPEFDRLDINDAGAGGAQIKVGMKHVITMQSGGAPKVQDLIVTMVLSRIDFRSQWVIDRVRAQEKPKP